MAPERAASLDADFSLALNMIDRLGDLQPGWNSYRAPTINEYARRRAKDLLLSLRSTDPRVPAPEVGPTPTGGVLLRWGSNGREIEIAIDLLGGSYSVSELTSPDVLWHGTLAEVDPYKQIIRPFVLHL